VRAKLLRYIWDTGWSGAAAARPWPDHVFTDMFQAPNGHSVRDFWLRSTFGSTDIVFDIAPWGVLQGRSQEELKDDRAAILSACRRQADRDGVPVAGYDHVIAFVHEPPANTGTVGADLVLNQSVPPFHRQVGRLLGFGPALGSDGRSVDPYCVMGGGPCRVAAATLFRYDPAFRASARSVLTHPNRSGAPRTVCLHALSKTAPDEPAVAVVPASHGKITVEYRLDAGLTPAIVVHSIGVRPADAPDRLVRFEAWLEPAAGAETTVLGVRVAVLGTTSTTATLGLTMA
jgi:hypothetical protein